MSMKTLSFLLCIPLFLIVGNAFAAGTAADEVNSISVHTTANSKFYIGGVGFGLFTDWPYASGTFVGGGPLPRPDKTTEVPIQVAAKYLVGEKISLVFDTGFTPQICKVTFDKVEDFNYCDIEVSYQDLVVGYKAECHLTCTR